MNVEPISVEISYTEPSYIFSLFAKEPWAILLDSANSNYPMEDTNRYSYIGFDPFEVMRIKNHVRIGTSEKIENPFQYVKNSITRYKLHHNKHLPPFQGGALGYFSYDLCHYLEEIPYPAIREPTPYADLALGFYDIILAFDHMIKKAWIISSGFPETTHQARLDRASMRIENCQQLLSTLKQSMPENEIEYPLIKFESPFTKNAYANIIEKAQNYILEGDIFEVNLSHRFDAELNFTETHQYDLYQKMRAQNPSPFCAFINLGDHQILSTSPERFLSLKDTTVSTRPIKGTTPRAKQPQEDRKVANALVNNEKDRSENIMIVDLLRNDLSKCCLDHSVTVKKLCGLESYPTVHHLVSVIEGKLRSDITPLDLLEACFPGGSITGAPKIRAMEIIYELEPTPRGPYCGSIGYIGFNGTMDTSITIRTLLVHNNKISYQAGGAVVLDSNPENEYLETLVKSASIRRTLSREEA